MDQATEYTLLGICILNVQKIEYKLSSILDHLSDEARCEEGFKNLTAEELLRDPTKLDVTLKRLEQSFGEEILLSNKEWMKFIEKRNLIVHSYWRQTQDNIKDSEKLQEDPESFLINFIEECEYWKNVLSGLIGVIRTIIAKINNQIDELNFTDLEKRDMKIYYDHTN